MAGPISTPQLDQLPPEMLDFALLKTTGALAPRLGRLSLPGRKPIPTPGFLSNTSRGVVPHISQDNFRKNPDFNGVYIPLEDFVEKFPQKTPPIFEYEVLEPLRRFIALPKESPIIMGARRSPPIPSPVANTNTEVGLLTSVGFRSISSEYYAAAARKLQPDIVIGLADIPFGQEAIGLKRKDKMSDRTETWMKDLIAKRKSLDKTERRFNIFAPILPIERDLQSWYLEHLVDDMLPQIQGVAIYDAFLLEDLPTSLVSLPRLSFDTPPTPHALLRQINLGIDLFTIPFINSATDSGIALDFTFPAPSPTPEATQSSTRHSLGIDMWSPSLATDTTPLSPTCPCKVCTNSHKAYIQHLLSAKEMLGWVYLQIHNHSILTAFFAGIRESISADTFDADINLFEAYYEPLLPEKTGQGPRMRGYQFKSESHGEKGRKNNKAYRKLDEGEVEVLRGLQGKKKEVRDVVDDEALVGLVGMDGLSGDVDGEKIAERRGGAAVHPVEGVERLNMDDDRLEKP